MHDTPRRPPIAWEGFTSHDRTFLRGTLPGPEGPDVVFSSEPYGDEIARRFGAEAVAVDPSRSAVPVSATLIRERPLEHLHFLAPPVRAWMEEQARGAAT